MEARAVLGIAPCCRKSRSGSRQRLTKKKNVPFSAHPFQHPLRACKRLGIDGVTPSILTPLPRTPIFEEWKNDGRLLYSDWTYYNGKTRVSFQPKHMTPEELYDGYMWFRKHIYSFRSILRRLLVSRTNVVHNLIINLGYKWAL